MIKRACLFAMVGLCCSFTVNREKKFIPPGTALITETFFADETEVSNLSWLEYEYATVVKYGFKSKEHLATLPDTLVWRNKESYNEPYSQHYLRHLAYRNYPVVGVSYEQVIAFCQWRTERVKEFYMIAYKKELLIEYRLPTREEWELLSKNGAGVFSNKEKKYKNQVKLNCFRETADSLQSETSNEMADVTAPVYSYWKNQFGLFNMFGNVSEMISEPGISKGGSWRHQMAECRPGKDQQYKKPEAWLGFRCVCVMKQKASN